MIVDSEKFIITGIFWYEIMLEETLLVYVFYTVSRNTNQIRQCLTHYLIQEIELVEKSLHMKTRS